MRQRQKKAACSREWRVRVSGEHTCSLPRRSRSPRILTWIRSSSDSRTRSIGSETTLDIFLGALSGRAPSCRSRRPVSPAHRARVARGRSPRSPDLQGHPDATAAPRAKSWSAHSALRVGACVHAGSSRWTSLPMTTVASPTASSWTRRTSWRPAVMVPPTSSLGRTMTGTRTTSRRRST